MPSKTGPELSLSPACNSVNADLRQAFVDEVWSKRKFPEAWSGSLDVSEFILNRRIEAPLAATARTYFVAGRIQRIDADSIQLFWGDETCEFFSLAENPLPNFLQKNDLINLQVHQHNQRWVIERWQLLAMASGEYRLKSDFHPSRAVAWNDFLVQVRAYFTGLGFTEYRTPTLVACPGTEPYLKAFSTKLGDGITSQDVFLPTSPEWHLKKLLVSGRSKIFEVRSCFRNEEQSEHHQPEFMMLEWYRAFANLNNIAEDLRGLLKALGVTTEIQEVSVAGLFKKHFAFDLRPQTTAQELHQLARSRNIGFQDDDDFDTIFHRLFLQEIERDLGTHSPLILRDYPPSQAALSRLTPSGWADRMELYWRGLELANGFNELNDPDENRRRLQADAEKKQELGFASVGDDPEFLQALEFGMPPAGGIALGLDRLFMALHNLQSIELTRPFPIFLNR